MLDSVRNICEKKKISLLENAPENLSNDINNVNNRQKLQANARRKQFNSIRIKTINNLNTLCLQQRKKICSLQKSLRRKNEKLKLKENADQEPSLQATVKIMLKGHNT